MLLTPAYETLLSRVTFMAVLDNNGVPRFHRQLTTLRTDDDQHAAMDFKYHGSDRFSVNRRPQRGSQSSFGDWQVEILDDSLAVTTSNVTTVSPLTHTDGHDFHISATGDYVMLVLLRRRASATSVGARGKRERHRGQPETRSSSAGPRPARVAVHLELLGPQRRAPGGAMIAQWDCFSAAARRGRHTYAHLNGRATAGGRGLCGYHFRGCSQVLRIDGSTGAVEWKLGGTAPPEDISPPEDSDAEFLELVEHSDPSDVIEEFCGPHHVTLTSSNTVVMYDNGVQCIGARKDAAPFSRAWNTTYRLERRRRTCVNTNCRQRRVTSHIAVGFTCWRNSGAACTG